MENVLNGEEKIEEPDIRTLLCVCLNSGGGRKIVNSTQQLQQIGPH